jgi:hypothetical protein
MLLIWGNREAKYFSRKDWTTQITLKGLSKLKFRRTRFWKLKGRAAKRHSLHLN